MYSQNHGLAYRSVSPLRSSPGGYQSPGQSWATPVKVGGGVSRGEREVVLAAAKRYWGEKDGLPRVVKEVKGTLLLESVGVAVRLVEDVLGKTLPPDLVEQCMGDRDNTVNPPCANGLMCPYVSERTHLDRYTHPCPVHYDTGHCSLTSNPTHTAFYSHADQRPIDTAPLNITNSQNYSPLSQPLLPTPTRMSYTASSPHDGRYSPRASPYKVDSNSFSTPPRGLGVATPITPPSSVMIRREDDAPPRTIDPAELWKNYMDLLKRKELTLLQRKYSKTAVVTVELKGEGMLREYRGLPNVVRFVTWMAGIIRTPSGVVVNSVEGEGNTARVVWKCPLSGVTSAREVVGFNEAGKVIRQKISFDYKKPIKRVVEKVSYSPKHQGPPVAFSDDPRLRGTPLTPTPQPRPKITTPPCHGASCSRASPTHFSRLSDEQRFTSSTKRGYVRPITVASPPPQLNDDPTLSEVEEQAVAAVRIQANFRGRLARKEVEQEKQEQAVAATKIQANFRGKMARKEVQQEKEEQADAATKIQANFRGKMARKEIEEKKEQEDAATMIQANFRGKIARKEIEEKKEQEDAATMIQANFRGKMARKEVLQEKEEQAEAATKIQANFRGKAARKELEEKKEQAAAATKIQANFRGKVARKEVEEKKEQEVAATKIQANFRGKAARKEVEERKEQAVAATKIQANFRGRMARREAGK